MDLFEEYKSLRSYMRRFDLLSSLTDVWHYSLHIMEYQPLPAGYAFGKSAPMLQRLSELLHPWDLDILARELVLNATRRGTRRLKNGKHLIEVIGHIQRVGQTIYAADGGPQIDYVFDLHRGGHRQLRWQIDEGVPAMMRALRVYGEVAVEPIVIRELGMTIQQLLRLGVTVRGCFLKNFYLSTNLDCSELGISREASDAFFKRVTCTLEQLKERTAACQRYDRDWLYTLNPLEHTPLVSIDPALPDRVLCPIPRYLMRRVSSGIFYDLVDSKNFANPFGKSFEAYVGDVIKLTCPSSRFTTLAEEPYQVGVRRMNGVDWVLSDNTGHLFIECKAKRLTLNAKTLSNHAALDKDLAIMAEAIAQHYQNIRRALDGKTRWVPDGRPVFPLVLTLEDWFIFSPRVDEMLRKHLCQALAEACIPEQVLLEMPYTIASAHEFEITSQIMARVGIFALMAKKTAPERRKSLLLPVVRTQFSEEMRHVKRVLFDNDWANL